MCDDWTKCDDCPPEKFIEEIEACGFECIMGDLKDHRGWIALKKRVANLQALFKSNCKVESIAIAKYAESQKRVKELEGAVDTLLQAFDDKHPDACHQDCFDSSDGHGYEMQELAKIKGRKALLKDGE